MFLYKTSNNRHFEERLALHSTAGQIKINVCDLKIHILVQDKGEVDIIQKKTE